MKQILDQLLDGDNLSRDEAFDAMLSIMSGEFDDAQIAGFLMALRAKGETVDEITGFAHAMRKKMVKVSLSHPAIDMCGTGGDSSGTFNISTAATFLVAGAGVHVAKHGNRSMTSKSGSADVLQALGIPINLAVEKSAELGGVYSAEHGTGKRKRLDFIKCYGKEAVKQIRRTKAELDPEFILNRGNVIEYESTLSNGSKLQMDKK